MPVGESDSGNPDRTGNPGSADRDPEDGLAAQVQNQVTELAQLRYQPWVRHELLRLLEARRRRPAGTEWNRRLGPAEDPARPGHYDPRSVTQFAYLPVEVGFDNLLVRDQLLITKDSYRGAKPYLDQLGLTPRPTGCAELDQTIERLVPHDQLDQGQNAGWERGEGSREEMRAPELADIARNLRTRGYCASVIPVPQPMGVTKGPNRPQKAKSHPGHARSRHDETARRPVEVAVIDTGIWRERLRDVDDGSEIDFLHEFPLGSRAEADQYLDFDAGHGTFVTGIVKQLAPSAGITVYRAIDSDGIGNELTVACKIIEAVDKGARIINLSLGCQTQDDYPPIALHQALKYAWERGVMVVAAAGNYADTRPCWPAAFRSVVSVAGLAPGMTPAQWSTRGFWVTCSAIGQGLLSWFVAGRESPLVSTAPIEREDRSQQEFSADDPWAAWSGTSFASAQVTGRLAQRYQAGEADNLRTVLREILAEGRSLPDFGQALEILPGI
jgi:subtilisin family serine protease